MTDGSGYAYGQLRRALRRADAGAAKADQWRAVLNGITDGTLTVGSRTPVKDTPAWVTLEVAHGGFATGRYLAEVPLRDDETATSDHNTATADHNTATADTAADDRATETDTGTTDRERLNLWYLTDTGQAQLLDALATGRYRIELPEDAALMTVAWLLAHDHSAAALDVVAALRPLMHRLRMTPHLTATAEPQGAAVRVAPVGDIRQRLRTTVTRRQLAAMRETLGVWHPLYDRLVTLWSDTVDGELPRLADNAVTGGWPAQTWPADWARRRADWLADHATAVAQHQHATAHRHPKSNFARLHDALLRSDRLTGRDVGWIRRALANTVTRHGEPGSPERAALRATQLAVAARPTHATLAAVLADRLDALPADAGVPDVDTYVTDTSQDETPGAGHAIPPNLVAKVTRALEAPVEELVARGVITSGDVLAQVLPQITASLLAADVDDPPLATLYARTYAAFRRRRGLLLLNLEHQVRFEELPWVAALEPLRARRPDAARAATTAAAQTTVLALHAFPQAILPNPLVRELGALTTQAEVKLPLVEEVAADIFTGSFTMKWRDAARVASRLLAETLYARYYNLPPESTWDGGRTGLRWGRKTAEDFAKLCDARARGARPQDAERRSWVAANGMVLEQSQILTTQNLAVLVHGLNLREQVTELAPALARRSLEWAVHTMATSQVGLRAVKNAAYAWRQAIFYLSLCDTTTQEAELAHLQEMAQGSRLWPGVNGLAHVMAGGTIPDDGRIYGGRRFLGWTTGRHWALTD